MQSRFILKLRNKFEYKQGDVHVDIFGDVPMVDPDGDSSSAAATPRRHRSGKASSEPALSPRSGKASSELGSQVGTFGTDDPRNSRLSLPL